MEPDYHSLLTNYDGRPVFIAEIGINHGGRRANTLELVDLALESGADIIKMQLHTLEDEMSPAAQEIFPPNADVSIWSVVEDAMLPLEVLTEVKTRVEQRHKKFLVTPFSRSAVTSLAQIGVSAVKVGSGEVSNWPLLEHICGMQVPVILSTGMHSLDDVKAAVDIFRVSGVPVAVLHCVSLYPTPLDKVRLDGISQLRTMFPDLTVGLSLHTPSTAAVVGAVALGARIIEVHFTDSHERLGPDVSSSFDPSEFASMRQEALEVFAALGERASPFPEEFEVRAFALASICATRDIVRGEVFSEENIFPMRPEGGDFRPQDLMQLIGRRCTENLSRGDQVPRGAVDLDDGR